MTTVTGLVIKRPRGESLCQAYRNSGSPKVMNSQATLVSSRVLDTFSDFLLCPYGEICSLHSWLRFLFINMIIIFGNKYDNNILSLTVTRVLPQQLARGCQRSYSSWHVRSGPEIAAAPAGRSGSEIEVGLQERSL